MFRGLSRRFIIRSQNLNHFSSSATASSTVAIPMSTPSLLACSNASGSVVNITLNRPKALNALDQDMCQGMLNLLDSWKRPDEGKKPVAFIVKGAGEKAFCAGGDVKSIWDEIANGGPDGKPLDTALVGRGTSGFKHSDFFRTEYHMNYALGTCQDPVQISLWNGFVMGGGVGISALGKYRIATDSTVFAMPETAIGLFPDVGSSHWLPHLEPAGFGMYIGLTGVRVHAYDLLRSGIATHYVPQDQFSALEEALMALPSAASQGDVEHLLGSFSRNPEPDSKKSLLNVHAEAIQRVFTSTAGVAAADPMGVIEAALTAEEATGGASSEWASKTKAVLAKMSPTSLAVTHEQLTRGASMDLGACLVMEFRASQRCMAADFQEGIRALLVDRDNKPIWKKAPSGLAAVNDFFEPLEAGKNDLSLK